MRAQHGSLTIDCGSYTTQLFGTSRNLSRHYVEFRDNRISLVCSRTSLHIGEQSPLHIADRMAKRALSQERTSPSTDCGGSSIDRHLAIGVGLPRALYSGRTAAAVDVAKGKKIDNC